MLFLKPPSGYPSFSSSCPRLSSISSSHENIQDLMRSEILVSGTVTIPAEQINGDENLQ